MEKVVTKKRKLVSNGHKETCHNFRLVAENVCDAVGIKDTVKLCDTICIPLKEVDESLAKVLDETGNDDQPDSLTVIPLEISSKIATSALSKYYVYKAVRSPLSVDENAFYKSFCDDHTSDETAGKYNLIGSASCKRAIVWHWLMNYLQSQIDNVDSSFVEATDNLFSLLDLEDTL